MSAPKVNNQAAYQWLIDNHVHWDRKDDNHIVVWTSGYKTCADDGHYGIELVLRTYGMWMRSESFDKMSGKTMAVYKHK